MKKTLFIISSFLLTISASAQTQVGQGNIIIDPYVGIPNWANSIIYNQYDGTNLSVENYKVNGGMLSYGGRLEYMLADNFGAGLDINYEVSGFNYDALDSTYVPSSNSYTVQKFNYDYTAKKLRIMARLNYHFVQSDRIDVYAGFAAGYKSVNRAFESNDPDYSDSETSKALIPVTGRISIGTRVYFTDNIGAMIELGAFGGGLLQFGLSAKF